MEGFESGFEVKEVYLRGNLVAARGKPQGPADGRWMRPDSD
jgi:hypothetical protein